MSDTPPPPPPPSIGDGHVDKPVSEPWHETTSGRIVAGVIGILVLVGIGTGRGFDNPTEDEAPTVAATEEAASPTEDPQPTEEEPEPSPSPEPVAVPEVGSLPASAYEAQLRSLGLEVRTEEAENVDGPEAAGNIADVDPPAGTELAVGDTVTVSVYGDYTVDLSEPITLSGSGSDVVFLEETLDSSVLAAVRVSGNSASRFFAVRAIAPDNDTRGVASSTDPYEGTRLLETFLDPVEGFEIEAQGDWTIEVIGPDSFECWNPESGPLEGSGESLYIVDGPVGRTLVIEGNEADRFFAVRAYTNEGRRERLVSDTEPFSGEVLAPSSVALLDIEAVGDWTIATAP